MPTSKPGTHRMDNLRIAEISGVDYPAHLEDGWLVVKSRQPSEEATVPINMDALDDEVREHIESLTEEVTKARDDLATATERLAEIDKGEETPQEPDLSDVLKSLPEDHPIRKAITDANTRAEAAERIALHEQETRLTGEFVAKARDLTALAIEPTEFGLVLKSLAENDPENAAKVYEVLKSANAAVSESGAFTDAGTAATSSFAGDAYGEIEKIAKARVETDPSKSLAEAIADVSMERPDLYRQHIAESRKGA